MSEKHEQIARRMIDDVWNRGQLDMIPQLVANDYVSHDPVNPGRGIQAATEVVTKYRTAFPDCRIDIDEMFSAGERVVMRFHYSGTHRGQLEGIPPTGRPVTGTGQTIYRFSGDRIQEAFTNWDALGMMQQLGVVTMPAKAKAAAL
jgi:steroid delta-isomerase-like uncharacterized protein